MNDVSNSIWSRRRVPAALVGFGSLLVVSLVGSHVALQGRAGAMGIAYLYTYAVGIFLSGIVAAVGMLLARSDVDEVRYPRVVIWCLGIAAIMLAINAPWIAYTDLTRTETVEWIHAVVSIGAAGGAIIGFIEARAIERAEDATRASVEAEVAEAERERLDYLNSLLRHEVLNSVQVINGNAELASEQSDGAVEDRLATIRSHSEDMAAVIRDVRTLITVSQATESSEGTDLSTLLRSELTDLRATYDSVDVEATIPDGVLVEGDELLARAFGNLLSNAVEHNESRTPLVVVSVEQSADTVSVRIEDDGPGIPDDERETLFERSTDGDHGFGLYLVDVLLERYDGTVELTDTGPAGSVFTVELPRAVGDTSKTATTPARTSD